MRTVVSLVMILVIFLIVQYYIKRSSEPPETRNQQFKSIPTEVPAQEKIGFNQVGQKDRNIAPTKTYNPKDNIKNLPKEYLLLAKDKNKVSSKAPKIINKNFNIGDLYKLGMTMNDQIVEVNNKKFNDQNDAITFISEEIEAGAKLFKITLKRITKKKTNFVEITYQK